MEKPADSQFPIHPLLRNRWSPRSFSDRRVDPAKLLQMLEAARWAPSCFNEQPWSFIVARKEEEEEAHGRLVACLTDRNRSWAGRAPVLMLSVAKLRFAESGKPNRFALHDVGLAMGNLIVQATALGLSVHQMAGFSIDRARASLGIPDTHEPVAMAALGYGGDPENIPEEFRDREIAQRIRNTLDSFVFNAIWGSPSPIVAGSKSSDGGPGVSVEINR